MSVPANSLDITAAGLVRFDGVSNFTGVTVTNHATLVAGASNAITSLALGTAGQALISNGAGVDPSYQTIPNSSLPGTGQITLNSGNNITVTGSPVALGGVASVAVTGTTNHAVQLGNASGSLTSSALGTAGQVLQSGGASADPAYSTATYPSTAGTSGNVLTSDGTNWTSSVPSFISISGTLTNAQIKALHATPVVAIAAPGANKVINIISANGHLVYGGTTPFIAAVSQSVDLWYNNNNTPCLSTAVVSNAMITSVASKFAKSTIASIDNAPVGIIDNVNVAFYNPVATEITGDVANDTTVNWAITYSISSL